MFKRLTGVVSDLLDTCLTLPDVAGDSLSGDVGACCRSNCRCFSRSIFSRPSLSLIVERFVRLSHKLSKFNFIPYPCWQHFTFVCINFTGGASVVCLELLRLRYLLWFIGIADVEFQQRWYMSRGICTCWPTVPLLLTGANYELKRCYTIILLDM